MNQGDIYLCDLDPVSGVEQGGRRPVLIVSSSEFNSRANAPIVLPITNGGGFAQRIGFAFPLPDSIATRGSVLCHQPRTLDIRSRNGRKIDSLPYDVLNEVLEIMFAAYD